MAQEKVNVEVIGHRGGRAEFEENTLSAFESAYKKGVHSFETDIRLTADNELVIIHDANLKRVAGKDMNVEESTREQISKIVTENSVNTLTKVSPEEGKNSAPAFIYTLHLEEKPEKAVLCIRW